MVAHKQLTLLEAEKSGQMTPPETQQIVTIFSFMTQGKGDNEGHDTKGWKCL